MDTQEILHILRNPYGKSEDEIRTAQLAACNRIEELQSAYTNMRDFAQENGLDTASRNTI